MDESNFKNNNKNSSSKTSKYVIALIILIALILLIFLLVRSCGPGNGDVSGSLSQSEAISSSGDASEESAGSSQEMQEIPEIGDEIVLGTYEQDAQEGNGEEDIMWLVLDVTEDSALLLSIKNLDCITYYPTADTVTWETSQIREWLNDDFINSSFTEEERSRILQTTVINEDHPTYQTPGGNTTEDKIFLLSASEVEEYLPNQEDRKALNTDHARLQGAYDAGGYGVWWTRSPGIHDRAARTVSYDGNISESGTGVEQDINVVRPALWISFSSAD